MTQSQLLERSIQTMQKYLTFQLAAETYGLPILQVREIIGLMDITRVPRMPGFMLGVVNLRGKVIPVADLRLKFGLPGAVMGRETCIIVVELEALTMGLLVDRVSEVLGISQEEVSATPDFGVSVDTDFILGMAKAKDQVVILLDIQKVLDTEGIVQLLATETTITANGNGHKGETP